MLKQNYMPEPASFPGLRAPAHLQEIDGDAQIRLFDKH
jgi:hypothetical protein